LGKNSLAKQKPHLPIHQSFQAPREMDDWLVITIAGTSIRLAEPKGPKSSFPVNKYLCQI
jgi:hypothetical protein